MISKSIFFENPIKFQKNKAFQFEFSEILSKNLLNCQQNSQIIKFCWQTFHYFILNVLITQEKILDMNNDKKMLLDENK